MEMMVASHGVCISHTTRRLTMFLQIILLDLDSPIMQWNRNQDVSHAIAEGDSIIAVSGIHNMPHLMIREIQKATTLNLGVN